MNASHIAAKNNFTIQERARAMLILRNRQKGKLLEETESLVNEELLDKARSNMLDFTRYLHPEYNINWHHKVLCKYLDKFARGEINRLMVFMPPKHAKTEYASKLFPAYLLGANPDTKIIACSHTAEYSEEINRDVQRIIDNGLYKEVFPDTFLMSKNVRTSAFSNYVRNATKFEIVNHYGSYFCAGVQGSISGKPGDVLILDDPFKGADTAFSKTFRDKAWRWYNTDFKTRRTSDKAGIIIIQTRWHKDDIAGRLLKENEDNWTVVNFPAIKTENDNLEDPRNIGEALWTEKFPLEYLMNTKKGMMNFYFSALYQQNPEQEGGGMFKRIYFKYFTDDNEYYYLHNVNSGYKVINKRECSVYATMDLAKSESKDADYTVFLVFALTPQKEILILDVFKDRVSISKHVALLSTLYERYKPEIIGIESDFYQELLASIGMQGGYNIKALKTGKKNKEMRAMPIATRLEAGNVYFKSDAKWLDDFEDELLSFPGSAHDDQVDAFAYVSYMIAPSKDYQYPFMQEQGHNPYQSDNNKVFNKNSIKRYIL